MKRLVFLFFLVAITAKAQSEGTPVRSLTGNGPPGGGVAHTVGTEYIDTSLTPNGLYTCTSLNIAAGPNPPAGTITCNWTQAGSGGITSPGGAIDATQPPYSAKSDTFINNDGVSTNGSPTFSAASRNCSTADIGKLVIVVASGGAYVYGNGLFTVIGCNGNSYTLSGNAGGNAGSGQNWSIGTDNNPAGCSASSPPCLSAAWAAAIAANKTLLLPCGALTVSTAPFTNVTSVTSFAMQRGNLQGCNATDGTIFVIHPNVLVQLPTGGTIFAGCPLASTGLSANGINGNQKIENFFLTSLNGVLPKTAGQNYNVISGGGCGEFRGITGQLFAMSNNAGIPTFLATSSETSIERLNFQNSNTVNGVQWQVVSFGGQGVNEIKNSIIAFTVGTGIGCAAGAYCKIDGVYFNTFTGTAVSVTGSGSTTRVSLIGNCITAAQGVGSGGAINDNNVQTSFYAFANGSVTSNNCTGIAGGSQAAFNLQNASSVLDVSGSDISGPAGSSILGSGQLNDRAGNSYSSALTNFTGKYIPIGGGSVANNVTTASTNFGTNIAAQTLVAASPGSATYDIKIGLRQTTLGVGCGAGSNTVNGTLNWTSGGLAQSATLNTLTVSANGAVGTSSNYQSIPIHVDVNTAITFVATNSTLASAGCSTVPQYAFDASNI